MKHRLFLLGLALPLFLGLLVPGSVFATTIVEPDHLQTLASANIYFNVLNGRSSPLYNITILLPSQLAPVGFYAGAGRWLHTVTRQGTSYRLSWFGGPVEPNGSVDFGVAVVIPATIGRYNSTVLESYQGNTTVSTHLNFTIYCPCVLGVDVRTLSYLLVVAVLLLPLVEIGLQLLHLLPKGKNEVAR